MCTTHGIIRPWPCWQWKKTGGGLGRRARNSTGMLGCVPINQGYICIFCRTTSGQCVAVFFWHWVCLYADITAGLHATWEGRAMSWPFCWHFSPTLICVCSVLLIQLLHLSCFVVVMMDKSFIAFFVPYKQVDVKNELHATSMLSKNKTRCCFGTNVAPFTTILVWTPGWLLASELLVLLSLARSFCIEEWHSVGLKEEGINCRPGKGWALVPPPSAC